MGMAYDFYRMPEDKLTALCADEANFEMLYVGAQGISAEMTLGKMWQGVHFTLTGTPVPTKDRGPLDIMYGGEPMADFEVGIAPPLGFAPDRVAATAAALEAADFDAMVARVSSAQLVEENVYLFTQVEEDDGPLRADLMHHLLALRAFFGAARDKKEAVLAILS